MIDYLSLSLRLPFTVSIRGFFFAQIDFFLGDFLTFDCALLRLCIEVKLGLEALLVLLNRSLMVLDRDL